MKWINVLHIYQPPTQSKEIVDLVVRESYVLIAELLEGHPSLRLTMNISGSLLELLDHYGHSGLIGRYRKFIESGQVELVGTAAYHPILPLLSEAEVRRQIELNEQLHKKYLGVEKKCAGFYLPEMAYSLQTAHIVENMGYQWVLLDDVGHTNEPISSDTKYSIAGTSLNVVFRNRLISKMFPPEYITEHITDIKGENLITVHDGELYGHHHKHANGYYEKAFGTRDVHTLTVSEYLQTLGKTAIITPREGSWETTDIEKRNRIPFVLWNDPHNKIHAKLWKIAYGAIVIIEKYHTDTNYPEARTLLDKSLASCAWWWAAERKLGPFSPLTWNPTEIEKGALLMLKSIRSLKRVALQERLMLEKKVRALSLHIWKRHWRLYTKEHENSPDSLS